MRASMESLLSGHVVDVSRYDGDVHKVQTELATQGVYVSESVLNGTTHGYFEVSVRGYKIRVQWDH